MPDSVSVPHAYVTELTLDYDQTYGGLDLLTAGCRVLVSRADDKAGQALLKKFMKRSGPTSVKYGIEGDPGVPQTLGGACHDLHVTRVQGHRAYQVGTDWFYGAEWTVRIVGEED
ncbi:hypothetical protein GA0074692_6799 [Micromonospora pallida]|uniref:Uncharacterized protein n=1 Tax=Micromonospora pallida TaxID=145854 RepID=A0A1C6TNU7_9ACTN|nr:hypothetical protein [Micromonospora pallida]SCL43272.1 hypothetical protein GA0074692_6799 [Micromonospora pallida]